MIPFFEKLTVGISDVIASTVNNSTSGILLGALGRIFILMKKTDAVLLLPFFFVLDTGVRSDT